MLRGAPPDDVRFDGCFFTDATPPSAHEATFICVNVGETFFTPRARGWAARASALRCVPSRYATERALLPAVHRAQRAAPYNELPPELLKAVDLLDRCAVCSRVHDGPLAATANSGPGPTQLNCRHYQTYRKYAALVLVDPLDRFKAMGIDSPGQAAELDLPALPTKDPETGL